MRVNCNNKNCKFRCVGICTKSCIFLTAKGKCRSAEYLDKTDRNDEKEKTEEKASNK